VLGTEFDLSAAPVHVAGPETAQTSAGACPGNLVSENIYLSS